MTKEQTPAATSEMLIRKPVTEVFEALADPAITSKFWFTKGSDRLESGKEVEWEWGQFGVRATIYVKEVVQNRRIVYQWPADETGKLLRTVEISFEARPDETTFVHINEKGFDIDDKNLVQIVAGQTEGWTLVLCGMKALLEHGINLNLISDHKPDTGEHER
jgi:uncharacterized protein YndB with AHSA1/START domain